MSDSDERDVELMAALARGEMPALGELARRHQEAALALARRMLVDRDQAEDVVQEAFLRVHRAAGRFRPEAKFSTWLYRIVLNLCRDRYRRDRSAAASLADSPSPANPDEPADAIEAAELGRAVRGAVQALPERQRTAVLLHRYQQLSHEEISQVTGWSVSAVESLLVRAYRGLREALADLDGPEK